MGGRLTSGGRGLVSLRLNETLARDFDNAGPRLESRRSFWQARGLLFFLADAVILGAAIATYWWYAGPLDLAHTTFVGLLLLLEFGSELQHPHRFHLNALEETVSVTRRVCVAYASASALALVTGVGDLVHLVGLAVVAVPLLLVGRSVSYALERLRRRRGPRLRTLVVGSGEFAEGIASAIESYPEFGLDVVGIIDDESSVDWTRGSDRPGGALQDIPEVIHSHRVSTMIVSLTGRSDDEIAPFIREALSTHTSVWVIPRFHEFAIYGERAEDLWGLPLVRLIPPGPAQAAWPLKRTFDVLCTGFGLLFAGPLMAVIAALIVAESGMPVLFRQRRVGPNGRHFDILKFRTMDVCNTQTNETEWVANAARTTKVGRLLRASGLDELPQLLNVLKGDMSLVGPRPERPFFVDRFARIYPRYEERHRVAGGITGLSQIRGLRGDTSILHRTVVDNYYIDTWRFWTDVKIIVRSLRCLIRSPELRPPVSLDELATSRRELREVGASFRTPAETDTQSPATVRLEAEDSLVTTEESGPIAFATASNVGRPQRQRR